MNPATQLGDLFREMRDAREGPPNEPGVLRSNPVAIPFLRAYTNAAADPTRTDLEDQLMHAVREILISAGVDLGLPPVPRDP